MKKILILAIVVIGGYLLSDGTPAQSLFGFLLIMVAAYLFTDYAPSATPEMWDYADQD